MASIKIIQGPDKGKVFQLQDGENILGRQEGGLELSDGTVSRRHVMLSRQGEEWLLTDLGSANGTYLNGVRVTKAATLNRGDQIRCGGTLLVFAGGQPTATMEAGVDSGIIDPITSHPTDIARLDADSQTVKMARAGFLGEDLYFMEFIGAWRAGKLTDPFAG